MEGLMRANKEDYKNYPGQYELHVASGEKHNDDLIVAFFYKLMRDHLPTGVVEGIVQDILQSHYGDIAYTNGWLEQYAFSIAERLRYPWYPFVSHPAGMMRRRHPERYVARLEQ